MARSLAIDEGSAWALHHDHVGRVTAVFRAATYVEVSSHLLAIVAKDVDSGPVHMRVDELPPCQVGDRVRIGPHVVTLSGHTWQRGPRWTPPAMGTAIQALPLLRRVTWHQADLSLGSRKPLSWDDVRGLAADPSLACHELVGRGAGLTPAGDDVAGGIVLAHAWTRATTPDVLAAAVLQGRTHSLSRTFLTWAARGQAIETVHQWVCSAARGDWAGVQRLWERLGAIGHTSGRDVATGVVAGLSAVCDGVVRREDKSADTHTTR